ncbi:MAG TPA: hypothetical protein VFB12_12480 [Ktedonobacteraceae bacterium]|nr:hypothetical protein [Ktedonobacteraceae bacterium]
MATRSATRATTKGVCSFCKGEFDKGKMTQHLKHCKERAATVAAAEKSLRKPKTRLLHLLVEGHYNPQYWMHLEIAASEALFTLDSFLRNIWLECCGHLSAFKIDGTNYESEPEGFFPFGAFEEVEEDEEDEEMQEENDLIGPDSIVNMEKLLEYMPSPFLVEIPSSWLDELKKPRAVDDLIAFAKEQLKSIRKGPYGHTPEERNEYSIRFAQTHMLKAILEAIEDRSMDVPLARVLKVGTKFSHEYDFGSTTYLDLKVVAEREGIVRNKRKPVEIMARNLPPEILCVECGKSAKQVVAGGYYDVEEKAYCNACAKDSEDSDMLLPIVNSPRVGVCGYAGD